MQFLISELMRSCVPPGRAATVGFVAPALRPCSTVMASTLFRVYDVIRDLWGTPDLRVELYHPWRHYQAVIFQKAFDAKALALARRLRRAGTKIVLDLNVNYFTSNDNEFVNAQQRADLETFLKECDALLLSTLALGAIARQVLGERLPVTVIEEGIDEAFFVRCKSSYGQARTLVWCGYAPKAKDVLLIRGVLENLRRRYAFRVLMITERDPGIVLEGVPVNFIRLRRACLPRQLLEGDVFIAPRDLEDPYNQAHAFTKIGLPMALGIPVIASPVPSYEGSPAVLCRTVEDWTRALDAFLSGSADAAGLGNRGTAYCRARCSRPVIAGHYRMFFRSLLARGKS